MPSVDNKRSLKVFLCHAHADRDPVRSLYTRLTKDGVDAWLDKANLLPGQDWKLEIEKAVREADVVIVCLSKEFNREGFRQKEVRWALDKAMEKPEGEIFIIPARLEECDTLESLRKWHWVDLFEADGYEMLMRALHARADKIGATLQVKKNWLPKITSPNMNFEKPVEKKKSVVSIPDESESKASDGKVEQKVIEDKEKRETAERIEEEKKQRELKRALKKVDQEYKRQIRKIEWQHRWESFVGEIRYRLKLLRINRVPILILLVTFGLIVPLLIRLSNLIPKIASDFNNTPTATIDLSPTPQQNLTFTEAFIPIEIFTPSSTPTEIVASTATPLPTEITDAKGVQMVLVPAGDFIMGSGSSKSTIYIDEYYIDKFEVTNSLYAKCVNDEACEEPIDTIRYANEEFADHPVVYVDWGRSQMFCKWRNGNLPTEAQWEKAARGVDGRKFPWGNQGPNSKLLNYFFLVGDSSPVGSYPSGASPYGAMDMAGNVWEWTNDWFGTTDSPENHVIKGGAWNGMLEYYFHSSYSQSGAEVINQWFFSLGFRCTSDASP